MTENEAATIIVDCAYKVHTTLGPGLLESVYESVLAHEIRSVDSSSFARCRLRFGMMT